MESTMSYKPTSNYTRINNHIIDKYVPYIGKNAYCIYTYYARLINHNSQNAWPSLNTTAMHWNISVRTVIRCNNILEKYQLITKIKGGGRASNKYKINRPNLKLLNRIISQSTKSSCDTTDTPAVT